jgi:hypothetical protein
LSRNEILIAIQDLYAQIENSLVTENQIISRLGELIAHAELLEIDDQLTHELIVVRSLMALKRHQRALDRFKHALLDTFFRPPQPPVA